MKEKFLDVYVAALPNGVADASLIEHVGRRAELLAVKNERLFREKFYSWRLLEKALYLRFSKTPTELLLSKNERGAWVSPFVYLSISHSEGALAVAVTSSPVGVDIEAICRLRAKNFAKRILNEREFSEFESSEKEGRTEELVRLWTMKEALFKKSGKERFVPSLEDTATGVAWRETVIGKERFVVSYASSDLEDVDFILAEL